MLGRRWLRCAVCASAYWFAGSSVSGSIETSGARRCQDWCCRCLLPGSRYACLNYCPGCICAITGPPYRGPHPTERATSVDASGLFWLIFMAEGPTLRYRWRGSGFYPRIGPHDSSSSTRPPINQWHARVVSHRSSMLPHGCPSQWAKLLIYMAAILWQPARHKKWRRGAILFPA